LTNPAWQVQLITRRRKKRKAKSDSQKIGFEYGHSPGERLDIKFPVDGLYSDKSEMALYVVELRVEEVHGG
jgi:hypothetical protein